ncbi:FtsX-like permease family protein [Hoylesella saccharolytica]|uniref:ABC transporter permease n=1 Tax=Hoylesella saccharolytica TaxID=633701 RepID=UPI0028D44C1B|nr:FtsX-like permease family protein [Hoylesella saccharolytica]
MNLPFFLARRIYTNNSDKTRVDRPAIRIAIAGVAIGLAVMLVSVSVVFGFKHTIRDKVVGFGSHIQVANFMALQTAEQYPIQMGDSMLNVLKRIPGVSHVQRYAIKQGILKTETDFLGVAFKGIASEYDISFIRENLVEGVIPKFSDTRATQQILISKTIADQLNLHQGSKVFAYFIDTSGVRTRRFTVAGIYQTNLSQYDRVICFIDFYTAVKLNGWEPDQAGGAELSVSNFDKLAETEAHVIDRVNRTIDSYGETYSSQTIKEANPQIFSWLDLLDLNVWIILGLMLAVAAVTMISGLLIIILERTTMIGILKALGARNRTIRHTFLWFAVFTIGKGMLIGNLTGIALIAFQHFTGAVKLDPVTYYVSTVPVEFNLPIFFLLNVATLFISVFVLIAPSYLVSKIDPAKSMRYE